ncbi:MAG: cell envelope integrity protein TolA, partial [Gammaproteobacteria bacterium]
LKQKKAAERKRKLQQEAAERKRRQELKRQIQAQNDKAFKQQLAAEAKQMQQQQQIEAQRRAALKAKQDEIDKYMTLIENKIYQHWVMPPATNKGLVCVYEVTLIPTGDVVNIELSKSSGDPVYDKSVKAAIQAASPLPVPPAGDGLFDQFRNLTLPVRADKKS